MRTEPHSRSLHSMFMWLRTVNMPSPVSDHAPTILLLSCVLAADKMSINARIGVFLRSKSTDDHRIFLFQVKFSISNTYCGCWLVFASQPCLNRDASPVCNLNT